MHILKLRTTKITTLSIKCNPGSTGTFIKEDVPRDGTDAITKLVGVGCFGSIRINEVCNNIFAHFIDNANIIYQIPSKYTWIFSKVSKALGLLDSLI